MSVLEDWSPTAGDNTAVGGVSIAEGMAVGDVNNAMRAMMADVAAWAQALSGVKASGGTANALTLTSGMGLAGYQNGILIAFRASASNTGATTINVDSKGATAIRRLTVSGAAALTANCIRKDGIYLLAYSEDEAAWILINPSAYSASDLTTGTLPSAQLSGHYTNMQNINSTTGAFGSTHADGVRLRPNGSGSTSNQARVAQSGSLMIGGAGYDGTDPTDLGINLQGAGSGNPGGISATTGGFAIMFLNRQTNDGNLIQFYQGGNFEGAISVSGATITYGSFCGAHWSQHVGGKQPILRGTIVETVDAMSDWPGDLNETLPKFKVSNTAGSCAVYGVFMRWDDADGPAPEEDAWVASLGAYMVRIGSGVTVARGDLIESAGDGTGRVQPDDILRASTVAKVTSPHVVEAYPDGSFLVPATLHCG